MRQGFILKFFFEILPCLPGLAKKWSKYFFCLRRKCLFAFFPPKKFFYFWLVRSPNKRCHISYSPPPSKETPVCKKKKNAPQKYLKIPGQGPKISAKPVCEVRFFFFFCRIPYKMLSHEDIKELHFAFFPVKKFKTSVNVRKVLYVIAIKLSSPLSLRVN